MAHPHAVGSVASLSRFVGRWCALATVVAGTALAAAPVAAQTYYSPYRQAPIITGPLADGAPASASAVGARRISTALTPTAAQQHASVAERDVAAQEARLAAEEAAHLGSSIHVQEGQQPCWDAAARYQHVPGLNPWLLYAVAYVESRHNPYAIGRNTNGSYDLGLMQINSSWFPTLKRYGISPRLLTNACASTFVGAWVLADTIHRYGYTWEAIGAYNTGSVDTPRQRRIGYEYALKVYAAYDYLVRKVGPNAAQWSTAPVDASSAARPPALEAAPLQAHAPQARGRRTRGAAPTGPTVAIASVPRFDGPSAPPVNVLMPSNTSALPGVAVPTNAGTVNQNDTEQH